MGLDKDNVYLEEQTATEAETLKEADFTDLFGTLKTKIIGQEFKDEIKKGWK